MEKLYWKLRCIHQSAEHICFILFLKAMYDSYVCQNIDSISEESQQPKCLYQSNDINKLRNRVSRLENDVTALIAENAQ